MTQTASVVAIGQQNLSDFAPFIMTGVVEDCLGKPSAAYGVLLGDKPCGAAVALCQPDMTARLLSVYVSPEHRRQGLGRRLIQTLLDWARQSRCDNFAVRYLLEQPAAAQVTGLLTACGMAAKADGPAFAAVEVGKHLAARQQWPEMPADAVISPLAELPPELQTQLLEGNPHTAPLLRDSSLAMATPAGEMACLLLGRGDRPHDYILLDHFCYIPQPGAALALLLTAMLRLSRQDAAATLHLLAQNPQERAFYADLFDGAVAYWTEQYTATVPLTETLPVCSQ